MYRIWFTTTTKNLNYLHPMEWGTKSILKVKWQTRICCKRFQLMCIELDLTLFIDRLTGRTFRMSNHCVFIWILQASTAQPIVVNSVHTTPAINTATTRSRESLTTSQLPPIASVAPVSHTIAHQAQLQPQPHIQTQQVNVSSAVPASVNVTTSATPSHVCIPATPICPKKKSERLISMLNICWFCHFRPIYKIPKRNVGSFYLIY